MKWEGRVKTEFEGVRCGCTFGKRDASNSVNRLRKGKGAIQYPMRHQFVLGDAEPGVTSARTWISNIDLTISRLDSIS